MNPIEFKIAQIRAGVSKEDIAKYLGVNPATIYRKFNGESDFTLSELRKLKKMLNLTNEDVDRIFFNDELAEMQERKPERSMRTNDTQRRNGQGYGAGSGADSTVQAERDVEVSK